MLITCHFVVIENNEANLQEHTMRSKRYLTALLSYSKFRGTRGENVPIESKIDDFERFTKYLFYSLKAGVENLRWATL